LCGSRRPLWTPWSAVAPATGDTYEASVITPTINIKMDYEERSS
jgi:hypothetical protein